LPFKYIILADDLTGSNDTGVQFARYGLRTFVFLGSSNVEKKIRSLQNKADVLVFNTESRADPPNVAYEKNFSVARALKSCDISVIYKKVDSTMRGNIGSEIDGVMDGLERKITFFTSAFPLNNRIIIGGHLLVNCIPLNLTDFARDPVSPVTESNVIKIISSQSKRKIGLVDYSVITSGAQAIREQINELIKLNHSIIVFDAFEQNDLALIANIIKDYKEEAIFSGSAGLAREIPKTLGEKEKEIQLELKPRGNLVFIFSGSANTLTLQQIEFLKHNAKVAIIDIDTATALKNEQTEIERILMQIKKIVSNETIDGIVIKTVSDKSDLDKTWAIGSKLGVDKKSTSKKIARFMGNLAKAVVSDYKTDVSGIILTGGDIAINTCETLGISALEILFEIDPGVPLSVGQIDDFSLYIVTKAGGFGKMDTLLKCLNLLKKKN